MIGSSRVDAKIPRRLAHTIKGYTFSYFKNINGKGVSLKNWRGTENNGNLIDISSSTWYESQILPSVDN